MVRYEVPRRAHIKLAVYDVIGREVAVLAEGIAEPVEHEAVFNAELLSSGGYLCRLASGDYTKSIMLLLNK